VDTDALADEIESLAAQDALAPRRDELTALAADLRSGKDLAQWAELDLLAAFARPESLAAPPPPPAASRPGPLRRLRAFLATHPWKQPRDALRRIRRAVREDMLEAALGVLVFVPLLITWFGLWEASRAYAELREEDPRQATRPFLQLWQSGFDGRVSPLGRFDSVAFMAALVIGVIVLTAVGHAWARARAERELTSRDQERDHLLGRLVAVLTRAQLALGTHLAASPRRFTGELNKAAGRLESLVRSAADGQRTLAKAASAARDATASLGDASRRLADASAPLGSAADRLEAVVRGGHAETARLAGANAAEMREVGERIGRLGQQIEAAVRELTGVQRELLDSTRAVVTATDRASQAMTSSSARTDDAVNGMREAAERWDVAAAHWQDAAARVDAGVRGLTGAPPQWGPGAPPPRGVG
jgi:hypothetical protein